MREIAYNQNIAHCQRLATKYTRQAIYDLQANGVKSVPAFRRFGRDGDEYEFFSEGWILDERANSATFIAATGELYLDVAGIAPSQGLANRIELASGSFSVNFGRRSKDFSPINLPPQFYDGVGFVIAGDSSSMGSPYYAWPSSWTIFPNENGSPKIHYLDYDQHVERDFFEFVATRVGALQERGVGYPAGPRPVDW